MRFLMIDTICSLQPGTSACGIKNISWDDDFLLEVFPGAPVFSSVIAAEAAAQLVSWIIVQARDFTVKPVITIVDSYACTGHIRPGDRLEVTGAIEQLSQESALAHGEVFLNGKTIIALNHAVAYLYPLHELDAPERARHQFALLHKEGYPLPRVPGSAATREQIPLRPRQWIDRIIATGAPDRLGGLKNITATEDFFNDHFPRKPILPGVMILESLASLGAELTRRALAARGIVDRQPVLKMCTKVKFRTFIQPGDQMVMQASLLDLSGEESRISLEATVNGKPAAMLRATFDVLDRDGYMKKYLPC
jgi:3-hydroxyacyl-[acyl-carrier-protein] dehydratase